MKYKYCLLALAVMFTCKSAISQETSNTTAPLENWEIIELARAKVVNNYFGKAYYCFSHGIKWWHNAAVAATMRGKSYAALCDEQNEAITEILKTQPFEVQKHFIKYKSRLPK